MNNKGAGAEFASGWRILLAASIGLGTGIAGYTAISSLFFLALQREFHWSSSSASVAFLALPLTACTLPLIGRLTDRFGVRVVAGFSALSMALSYWALSVQSGMLNIYYACFLALNLLGSGTGPVTYTRLITAHFVQARGSALALAQFGIAALAAALPPVVAHVIAANGWRAAYDGMAGLTLAGAMVAQWLIRTQPKPAGHDEQGKPSDHAASAVLRAALRTRHFWTLAAAVFLLSAGSLGMVTQFQGIFASRGFSLQTGGWLLSLMALAVMGSRLISGIVLDRPNPGAWAAAIIALAAAGAVVLVLAGNNVALIALGLMLFSFSVGAELDLMGFFCARCFGTAAYSSIYSLIAVGFYLGMAAGSVAYGALFDHLGRYDAGLWLSAMAFLIAAGLFASLNRRRASIPVG